MRESVARLREANARLREVVASKDGELAARDAEMAMLRAEHARLESEHARLALRVAELERRLGMDSTDSGTPSSKEPIAARERRKAARRERNSGCSSRERSPDRKPGGQPGHPGTGLRRDRDPNEVRPVEPPAECSSCGGDLQAGADAGAGWAQTWDVEIVTRRVEYRLPRRRCRCCGKVTTARPPQGQAGTVCYGPGINSAAILLSSYGNVPTERAASPIEMLLGVAVSAGFVDRASARLAQKLAAAGFDEAMRAALLAEPALGADESPVYVLRPQTDPDTGEPLPGAAQVMVVRTPDERLVWLRPLVSRAARSVLALLEGFAGYLIVDGYSVYQRLLGTVKGIQQCCQHIIRRCRQVAKLGPGSLQSWTQDVRVALAEAHDAVTQAKAGGVSALDADTLAGLRARYDQAVAFGQAHNRHRDWHQGNHPGYVIPGTLAGRTRRSGVAVRDRVRRRVDQQRQRARHQRSQTTSGRVRVLAHPTNPWPVLPDPLLPHVGTQPRQRASHGRHPRRPQRKPLAPHCRRSMITRGRPPEWTPLSGA